MTAMPQRRNGLAKLNALDDPAVAQALIDRLSAGELTKHLAKELGVDKSSLRHKLRAIPTYKQAIIDQAESLMEDATAYCIECSDKDDAPIARVRLEGARSWAQSRDPKNWGPKQELTHNLPAGPLIQVNLSVSGATLGATVIDGDAKIVDNQ